MDFKLELVLVPVTDVDRAKSFYVDQAGFYLEVDTPVGPDMRGVQVTPPGSACSVGFGTGIPAAPPGSAQGPHLLFPDLLAARAAASCRRTVTGCWRRSTAPRPRCRRRSCAPGAAGRDPTAARCSAPGCPESPRTCAWMRPAVVRPGPAWCARSPRCPASSRTRTG